MYCTGMVTPLCSTDVSIASVSMNAVPSARKPIASCCPLSFEYISPSIIVYPIGIPVFVEKKSPFIPISGRRLFACMYSAAEVSVRLP